MRNQRAEQRTGAIGAVDAEAAPPSLLTAVAERHGNTGIARALAGAGGVATLVREQLGSAFGEPTPVDLAWDSNAGVQARWKQDRARRLGGLAADASRALGVSGLVVDASPAGRRKARAAGASGLAVGRTVHLDLQRVDPLTRDGRRTVAHEVAHVAQASLPTASGRDAAGLAEGEAEAWAERFCAGGALPALACGLPSGHVAADTGAGVAPIDPETYAAWRIDADVDTVSAGFRAQLAPALETMTCDPAFQARLGRGEDGPEEEAPRGREPEGPEGDAEAPDECPSVDDLRDTDGYLGVCDALDATHNALPLSETLHAAIPGEVAAATTDADECELLDAVCEDVVALGPSDGECDTVLATLQTLPVAPSVLAPLPDGLDECTPDPVAPEPAPVAGPTFPMDPGPPASDGGLCEAFPTTSALDALMGLDVCDLAAGECRERAGARFAEQNPHGETLQWGRRVPWAMGIALKSALGPFVLASGVQSIDTFVFDLAGVVGDRALAPLLGAVGGSLGEHVPVVGPALSLLLPALEWGRSGRSPLADVLEPMVEGRDRFAASLEAWWDTRTAAPGRTKYDAMVALAEAMSGLAGLLTGAAAFCGIASAALFVAAVLLAVTGVGGASCAVVAATLAAANTALGAAALAVHLQAATYWGLAFVAAPDAGALEDSQQRLEVASSSLGSTTGAWVGDRVGAALSSVADDHFRSPEPPAPVDLAAVAREAEARTEVLEPRVDEATRRVVADAEASNGGEGPATRVARWVAEVLIIAPVTGLQDQVQRAVTEVSVGRLDSAFDELDTLRDRHDWAREQLTTAEQRLTRAENELGAHARGGMPEADLSAARTAITDAQAGLKRSRSELASVTAGMADAHRAVQEAFPTLEPKWLVDSSGNATGGVGSVYRSVLELILELLAAGTLADEQVSRLDDLARVVVGLLAVVGGDPEGVGQVESSLQAAMEADLERLFGEVPAEVSAAGSTAVDLQRTAEALHRARVERERFLASYAEAFVSDRLAREVAAASADGALLDAAGATAERADADATAALEVAEARRSALDVTRLPCPSTVTADVATARRTLAGHEDLLDGVLPADPADPVAAAADADAFRRREHQTAVGEEAAIRERRAALSATTARLRASVEAYEAGDAELRSARERAGAQRDAALGAAEQSRTAAEAAAGTAASAVAGLAQRGQAP